MNHRIKKLLMLILMFSGISFSQWEVRGSMGLNFVSIPSLRDYINSNYAFNNNKLGDFISAVEFSGEAGYELNDNQQISFDAALEINSFTLDVFGNNYNLEYSLFMPSAAYYKLIKGSGYKFKFGVGAGLIFYSLDESRFTRQKINYSSTGFSIFGKAEGETALSKNVFADIAVNVRYRFSSEPEDKNGNKIPTGSGLPPLNMKGISFGISIGVVYWF